MRHANKVLGVMVAVLVGAALYAAAYLADMELSYDLTPTYGNVPMLQPVPDYRIGGSFAEMVFTPAHRVDVWLRPDMWTGIEYTVDDLMIP